MKISIWQTNPAGEATKWNYDKSIQQQEVKDGKSIVQGKVPTILNSIKEVCTDGVDNDKNKLVDCNDLNACYSKTTAINNICKGKNDVDSNKILLTGIDLGFDNKNQIKSFSTQAYKSGEDACFTQLNVLCVSVEFYLGNNWRAVTASTSVKDQKITCATVLEDGTYDLTKRYRAVCAPGLKSINPEPLSPPSVPLK